MRSALAIAAISAALVSLQACGSSDPEPTDDGSSGGTSGTSGTPGTSGTSGTSGTPGTSGTSGTSGVTPTSKAVRFVVMGDTGDNNTNQQKVANAIAAKCKASGCDFVQLLGDNLYDSGASSVDDPIWQTKFEVPYAAIDLPFWAVLGNHDYGANGLGTDFPKGKNEVDYTKKSKKWKMPAAYYDWHKENIHFFGLDTNMILFGQDAAQRTDMKAFIAASTEDWKIAFGHHPYKSNGPHGNAGVYDGIPIGPNAGAKVKSFLEDVVCGKVDIYMCGHDHSRQWLNESCMGTELVVSGAGAKTTELPGKNAALFQSIEVGFLYVVIDGKNLTAEFMDENGKVEFTHKKTKP